MRRASARVNAARHLTAVALLAGRGLPGHFTPHCLRPTFASILISEDGGLIEYVSRMLGHADIRITVATYGRWLQPAGRAVNRLFPSVDAQDRAVIDT